VPDNADTDVLFGLIQVQTMDNSHAIRVRC